jgi:uncharacterized protein (TIGR03067 family)
MSDTTAIEGTWVILKAELAGEPMPEMIVSKIEVELTAGEYTMRFGGDVADRGTYELGAHPTAEAITLTGVVGTNAGRTIPAIYQFVGEHLHIIYGLDGNQPGGFATRPDPAHFLAVYRRKPRASGN